VTVELFTSAVLVANVDHVSSLCEIPEGRAQHRLSAGRRLHARQNRERWEELCRQAAEEKDPKRLLEITTEINCLLAEKENRLLAQREQNEKKSSE